MRVSQRNSQNKERLLVCCKSVISNFSSPLTWTVLSRLDTSRPAASAGTSTKHPAANEGTPMEGTEQDISAAKEDTSELFRKIHHPLNI